MTSMKGPAKRKKATRKKPPTLEQKARKKAKLDDELEEAQRQRDREDAELFRFWLKKLERDYDPTDRSRAIQLLEEANRKDWLITGLIYIDTQQPSLFDFYNLPETPLNRLEPEQMRPAPETIDQVNAMMF